jgi:methylenetetrahydrofolate dehydrogenase (NAD+)
MILLRNLLVCTAMANYFKSLSPSQLHALKSLELIQEQNTQNHTTTPIASEQNTSTPPIDSMLSSSILENPAMQKGKTDLLLEQTADELQRMVQNNPDVDAKPAEAIEKKGTIEEVVAA